MNRCISFDAAAVLKNSRYFGFTARGLALPRLKVGVGNSSQVRMRICHGGCITPPVRTICSASDSCEVSLVRIVICFGFFAFLLSANSLVVSAATIFESGTLGPTGIPRSEITGGSNVSASVFVGVRFYLNESVNATHVGGHFVRNTGANESLFGTIVSLSDPNDFPDSGNLSTPDVVGTTLLAFPEPSNEVFGALAKPLAPGWYALVFGSGLFATTGSGVAVNNGVDIGSPTYIARQVGAVNGWSNLINPIFRNFRFVVQGQVVPEPSAINLLMVFLFCGWFSRSPKRQ